MSFAPFLIGTLIYLILGVAAIVAYYVFGSRKQFGLVATIVTITVFCMWLLWGITWLMQWHPLIRPIKEKAL